MKPSSVNLKEPSQEGTTLQQRSLPFLSNQPQLNWHLYPLMKGDLDTLAKMKEKDFFRGQLFPYLMCFRCQ